MSNSIYTLYIYLVGWSSRNKYYLGVRYAKNCHPKELWETYFTSSKHVSHFRKAHGEPDIVQIRKTFDKTFSKKVDKESIEDYLQEGWQFGRVYKTT